MYEASEDVYENLAKALGNLPNGFPRTPAKTEIKILKKIFYPKEAFLASHMSRRKESAESIANRIRLSGENIESQLKQMANRGLLWSYEKKGKSYFRLAPFMVGIYES